MAKLKIRCKYCGGYQANRTVCSHCSEKLKLIRYIQAMLRAEKKQEEARSRVRPTTNQIQN